jgi:hypothetical protein
LCQALQVLYWFGRRIGIFPPSKVQIWAKQTAAAVLYIKLFKNFSDFMEEEINFSCSL